MNFNNEITKLQSRVAAIEAKVHDPSYEVPKELAPESDGIIVPGAAKTAVESKPGADVQKGPAA